MPGLYRSTAPPDEQRAALTTGNVPVAVYGLGKMGLPLAAVYADVTGNVTGVDVDQDVVDSVSAGRSHVSGEPGLDDLVARTVENGAFDATTDGAAAARDAAIHVIIVPTLVDETNDPDLSIVESVLEDVATGLDHGDLVVVESTVPPRSCRDAVVPTLEAESDVDRDGFGVAFCPERTSSGRALQDIREAYPKVVGGVDAESGRLAELVYGEITSNDIVRVADATTAETVKVLEGVYRDVNIALVNEVAQYARDLDVSVVDAIDAANTQPYCDLHTPSAGVGGHCIPYYPYFLIGQFETASPLLETARRVNDTMPTYVADRTCTELDAMGVDPADADVLVLGLTYRPGVAETRKSPALPIIGALAATCRSVTAVDPVLDDAGEFADAGASITTLDDLVKPAQAATDGGPPDEPSEQPASRGAHDPYDAVVLVTNQSAFGRLDVPGLGPEDRDLLVVDGSQSLRHLESNPDVRYRGVGINL